MFTKKSAEFSQLLKKGVDSSRELKENLCSKSKDFYRKTLYFTISKATDDFEISEKIMENSSLVNKVKLYWKKFLNVVIDNSIPTTTLNAAFLENKSAIEQNIVIKYMLSKDMYDELSTYIHFIHPELITEELAKKYIAKGKEKEVFSGFLDKNPSCLSVDNFLFLLSKHFEKYTAPLPKGSYGVLSNTKNYKYFQELFSNIKFDQLSAQKIIDQGYPQVIILFPKQFPDLSMTSVHQLHNCFPNETEYLFPEYAQLWKKTFSMQDSAADLDKESAKSNNVIHKKPDLVEDTTEQKKYSDTAQRAEKIPVEIDLNDIDEAHIDEMEFNETEKTAKSNPLSEKKSVKKDDEQAITRLIDEGEKTTIDSIRASIMGTANYKNLEDLFQDDKRVIKIEIRIRTYTVSLKEIFKLYAKRHKVSVSDAKKMIADRLINFEYIEGATATQLKDPLFLQSLAVAKLMTVMIANDTLAVAASIATSLKNATHLDSVHAISEDDATICKLQGQGKEYEFTPHFLFQILGSYFDCDKRTAKNKFLEHAYRFTDNLSITEAQLYVKSLYDKVLISKIGNQNRDFLLLEKRLIDPTYGPIFAKELVEQILQKTGKKEFLFVLVDIPQEIELQYENITVITTVSQIFSTIAQLLRRSKSGARSFLLQQSLDSDPAEVAYRYSKKWDIINKRRHPGEKMRYNHPLLKNIDLDSGGGKEKIQRIVKTMMDAQKLKSFLEIDHESTTQIAVEWKKQIYSLSPKELFDDLKNADPTKRYSIYYLKEILTRRAFQSMGLTEQDALKTVNAEKVQLLEKRKKDDKKPPK
ncbi:MAG: hypothetical protein ACK4NC_06675 [Candidatus Gracilibacteria bacterium]